MRLPIYSEYETEAQHWLHIKFKAQQNKYMLKYSLESILIQGRNKKILQCFDEQMQLKAYT